MKYKDNEERKDVETRIAKNDRCCGCGLCAAMCPLDCITMKFNIYKQYVPVVDRNVCINCGQCLRVCPDYFETNPKPQEIFGENYTSLKMNEFVGFTLGCYLGYVTNEQDRLSSSSGGVLTALLRELFELNYIDAVILAGKSEYTKTGKFFEAKIITDIEGILNNRGSKYYPIEYSGVIKTLKSDSRRYAIVALPCVTLALRKAQALNKALQRNIRYILTPVCGHNVSALYTEYLLRINDIDPSSVIQLKYRDKTNATSADDFNLLVEYKRGDKKVVKRLSFRHSDVGATWISFMFAMNKCLYCTDFVGEFSDASFADAWLYPYINDYRGTSMVILRNVELNQLIQRMVKDGKLKLLSISPETFIKAHTNRFRQKKDLIKSRIKWQKVFNKDFPDYGVDWRSVKLWYGLPENLKLWLHIHLSRWLYRHGLLTKIGTKRFLKFCDTPIELLAMLFKCIRKIRKST